MIGVGIGLPFYRSFGSGVDAQAQVHFNRVIADGGVVPSGLSGVNAFFSAVKAIYGTTDINTAISAAYDAHYLGYKLGAGSGTTLGQAAQKLYAPKGIFGGIGTGSAFYDSVGVTGNFINTPSIGIDTNSGMSVDVKVALVSGVTYTSNWICSNDNGSTNRNMFLGFTSPNRTLIVYWSNLTRFASSTIALSDGFDGWIRCSLETSGSDMLVRFFTSLDGITYTQLGATITNSGGANTFQTSNAPFNITGNGGANIITGKIYRVIYRNASGVVRADFNANQYTGANTWTSTTSEVWTVNSTGAGLADVIQTTAASQPLLLEHTGQNYWFAPYSVTDNCSTPNAAANRITGDIEIVVNFSLNSINFNNFCSKWTASNIQYHFRTAGGNLQFRFSTDGTTTQTISSTANISPSVNWVKLERNATNGEVKFYTSANGTTWTQLGATVTGVSGNMFNGTAPLVIGQNALNGADGLNGKIFRVTISNSIGGTPVVDFNPASYNPSVSQTQWTSATGEVWTINTGTATTGYKGAVITKSIVMSDGVDDRMQAATLNINTTAVSLYSAFRKYNNTAAAAVIELGTDYSTTNGFGLFVNSLGAAAEAFGIFGNVFNGRVYNSNSLLLKLSTAIGDTSIPDPETQYFINNSAQSVFATFSAANNTTGINQTGLNVFGKSGGTSLSNLNMNTLIISNTNNNLTNRTAMYDYIKSINNNAF